MIISAVSVRLAVSPEPLVV